MGGRKTLSPLGQKPHVAGLTCPTRPKGLSSTTMAIGTFNIRTTKPKVVKTRDGTDVAARYFVYKLYEATDGQPMQWPLNETTPFAWSSRKIETKGSGLEPVGPV